MFEEESIQRVQAPPPKRKQFVLKLENKANSYHDVFLRFLAGEKQPTLEVVSEHANKKPKDNIFYSTNSAVAAATNQANNSNLNNQSKTVNSTLGNNQTSSSKITISSAISSAAATAQSSTQIGMIINNASQVAGVNPTTTIDKENYYNSSRRENLLPLNNYEYRNSYKDHYDNQGVRVNPAVLKNLSYSSAQTSGPQNSSTDSVSVSQLGNTRVIQSSSNSALSGQQPNRLINLNDNSVTPVAIISSAIVTNGDNTLNQITKSLPSKSSIVITKTNQINTSNVSVSNSLNELNQMFNYTNNINTNTTPNLNKTTMDEVTLIMDTNVNTNGMNHLDNNANTAVQLNSINMAAQPEHVNINLVSMDKTQMNELVQQGDLTDNQNKMTDGLNHIKKNDQTFEQVVIESNHNNIQVSSVNEQQQQQQLPDEEEEVTFAPGEFLIHKSTFSGDFDNYDIWCVLDYGYLQKYEPVLLATGERCHQSADVLAQYTPDKSEFLLVKVEEKGKTEQNNIVVGVLNEYEPKNRKIFISQLVVSSVASSDNAAIGDDSKLAASNQMAPVSAGSDLAQATVNQQTLNTSNSSNNNVVVVTYDDLKTTLDVFLQVLLSQHLNGEFLSRIKEIQDEYFKPSIEFIDTILNEKYSLLINSFNHFMNLKKSENSVPVTYELEPLFKYLFETKPKLITQQMNNTRMSTRCQATLFSHPSISIEELSKDQALVAEYIVTFGGQSYNSDTLMPITDFVTPISNALFLNEQMEKEALNKEFLVCTKNLQFTQLCHSLKHLKMHFYEICQQKIETVKLQINETNAAGTAASDILNYCLADTQWLLEMFEKFKQLLFDVDSLLSDDQLIESDSNNPQSNVMEAHIEVEQQQQQQQQQQDQMSHIINNLDGMSQLPV